MCIETYINDVPDERKERFIKLMNLIKSLYPEADESMKYKMPTYEYEEGWVALANQKNYISLYTCSAYTISPSK